MQRLFAPLYTFYSTIFYGGGLSGGKVLSPLGRRYGWKPDLPDIRDTYHSVHLITENLPSCVDLRATNMPPVYDQGHLGSCTANAIAGALHYDELKQSLPNVAAPSRLFIYYNERDMEGNVGTDSGAAIRDGIQSVHTQGYCNETTWPYDITRFTQKPSTACYTEALQHTTLEYKRVKQDMNNIRAVLASGFPVVYGFTVYESFESAETARTGVVSMPHKKESVLGGHAILAVGYDDDKKHVIFRNSWGEGWGDKGYGYMPYDYISNEDLADDFWTVVKVR